MASMDLGSLTYSVITANQIRLVDRENRGRERARCGFHYFFGSGVLAFLNILNPYADDLSMLYRGGLFAVCVAFVIFFWWTANQYPSGGVVDILEANGLPLEEVTVRVKATPVNNAGEPVSFPEPSMVPQ